MRDGTADPGELQSAGPSSEFCSCCETQFGVTDYQIVISSKMEDGWMKLRLAWLIECGWSNEAIQQLQNLGFSREQVLAWNKQS